MGRAALWLGVALLLALVGAAVSYTQKDRFRRDDDVAGSSTPPLSETPVLAIQDCPWGEAGCILAQGIERALQAGRVDAVVDLAAPTLHVCPGPRPQGSGGPFPLCNGAAPSEGRFGYNVGRRYSEGAAVTENEFRARIQRFVDSVHVRAQDEVGKGDLRLFAFTCTQRAAPAQNVSCARLGIVFSAVVGEGSDAHREVLIFWAVAGYAGKTLPITEVWDGIVLAEERPILFQTGGHLPDLGEVDVIDDALAR
ncbi:MAG TPA: hypothetical protein VNN21_09220 [Dehalococcoidia bacterium]|nr:hypothetical protein [Dehalococcoidia bacterium]